MLSAAAQVIGLLNLAVVVFKFQCLVSRIKKTVILEMMIAHTVVSFASILCCN